MCSITFYDLEKAVSFPPCCRQSYQFFRLGRYIRGHISHCNCKRRTFSFTIDSSELLYSKITKIQFFTAIYYYAIFRLSKIAITCPKSQDKTWPASRTRSKLVSSTPSTRCAISASMKIFQFHRSVCLLKLFLRKILISIRSSSSATSQAANRPHSRQSRTCRWLSTASCVPGLQLRLSYDGPQSHRSKFLLFLHHVQMKRRSCIC